jgi:hypothetical protein
MNLAGIVVPGERTPSVPGRWVRFRNGVVRAEVTPPSDPQIAKQALAEKISVQIPEASPTELRLFQ